MTEYKYKNMVREECFIRNTEYLDIHPMMMTIRILSKHALDIVDILLAYKVSNGLFMLSLC
jgi:hypothetical protein